jgi:hypothetical protein
MWLHLVLSKYQIYQENEKDEKMKFTRKEAYFIYHEDFNKFVDVKMGFEHPYSVCAELDTLGPTAQVLEIDAQVNEWDIRALGERRADIVPVHPRVILDFLCHLKKIPKGTYIIEIY